MPIQPNIPQCLHTKVDGVRCGSPALTGKNYCYFHNNIRRRPKKFELPPVEDANALQVAIMEIIRAVADDRLELKKASILLYAVQIAQANMGRIALVQPTEEVHTTGAIGKLLDDLLGPLSPEEEAERKRQELEDEKYFKSIPLKPDES